MILFNGHVALLDILELLNIQIGQAVYEYCHYIDEERWAHDTQTLTCAKIAYALKLLLASTKKFFDAEEILYGPGIAE